MALPSDVFGGVAAAMNTAVPNLTTTLPREADATDNDVHFPHGDMVVVSNIRADEWNTDFAGWVTDDQGNEVGRLFDALFDIVLQMNVWIAVPSDDWDIQNLGGQLERGLRRYDVQQKSDPLPDGDGGILSDVDKFRLTDGGTLPTEPNQQPPLRGYQVTAEISFEDRIDTTVEYDESGPYVATVDTPSPGDMTGGDSDDVAIEYHPA